jgi:hypothetical protein
MIKRFVLCGLNEYDGSCQYFCQNIELKYNRKGNIVVQLIDKEKSPPWGWSFVPFFSSRTYIFNRQGVCISHPPSTKYKHHKLNAYLC